METITTEKHQQSADIQQHITQYLEGGGKIEQLPSYVEMDATRQHVYFQDPEFQRGALVKQAQRSKEAMKRLAKEVKSAEWLPDGDLMTSGDIAKRYGRKVASMQGRIKNGIPLFPKHKEMRGNSKLYAVAEILEWEVAFLAMVEEL